MSFIEFLIEYYIYILVVLIILIVGVIGFLVDSKSKSKKKMANVNDIEKKSNENMSTSTLVNEASNLNASQVNTVNNNVISNDVGQPAVESTPIPNVDPHNVQNGMSVVEQSQMGNLSVNPVTTNDGSVTSSASMSNLTGASNLDNLQTNQSTFAGVGVNSASVVDANSGVCVTNNSDVMNGGNGVPVSSTGMESMIVNPLTMESATSGVGMANPMPISPVNTQSVQSVIPNVEMVQNPSVNVNNVNSGVNVANNSSVQDSRQLAPMGSSDVISSKVVTPIVNSSVGPSNGMSNVVNAQSQMGNMVANSGIVNNNQTSGIQNSNVQNNGETESMSNLSNNNQVFTSDNSQPFDISSMFGNNNQ